MTSHAVQVPDALAGVDERELTFAAAIAETLGEVMRRDSRVYVMGEDVGLHGGVFRCTAGLYEEFGPERVRDTPISESAIVGAGLGSALTGMRPVVEIQYSDFLPEAMDQVVNQVAKARYMSGGQVQVPIVIRAPGGRGKSAASQHSQSLETWFAHVPGLIVLMPSTPADAKGLLRSAIECPDPVLFLEHKLLYRTKGLVPPGDYFVPIGRAAVRRSGRDVTIVTASWMVMGAVEAAATLAREGIEAEVVDIRSLVPLDEETVLSSVARTGRLIVAHEATKQFGWGGEVVSRVTEKAWECLKAPPVRIGARYTPVPMAPVLEESVLPTPSTIVRAAHDLVAQ